MISVMCMDSAPTFVRAATFGQLTLARFAPRFQPKPMWPGPKGHRRIASHRVKAFPAMRQ
jgi:hypothetical protein